MGKYKQEDNWDHRIQASQQTSETINIRNQRGIAVEMYLTIQTVSLNQDGVRSAIYKKYKNI